MTDDMVKIPRRTYESLRDDQRWRIAMELAGVDNWQGYDYAMEFYRGNDSD